MKGKERTIPFSQTLLIQQPQKPRMLNYHLVSMIAMWLAEQFFWRPFSYQEIEIKPPLNTARSLRFLE